LRYKSFHRKFQAAQYANGVQHFIIHGAGTGAAVQYMLLTAVPQALHLVPSKTSTNIHIHDFQIVLDEVPDLALRSLLFFSFVVR
jgi:hypothetical protein